MSGYLRSSDSENVLRLLRRLSPRERLRVVMQVLPDLEKDLPQTAPARSFWQSADLRTLAQEQGVEPIEDWQALLGGWPEDETVDDFLAARQEWHEMSLVENGDE